MAIAAGMAYNNDMQNYRFIIRGRVQGVWYRRSVQTNAARAGFSGYVRNLSDGTVEAEVTCEKTELEAFKKILERGSDASRVDAIDMSEGQEMHSGGFEVR